MYMCLFSYLLLIFGHIYQGEKFLCHMIISCLTYVKNYQTVFHSSCTNLCLHKQYIWGEGSNFCTSSLILVIFRVCVCVNDSYPSEREVLPHSLSIISLTFHFPLFLQLERAYSSELLPFFFHAKMGLAISRNPIVLIHSRLSPFMLQGSYKVSEGLSSSLCPHSVLTG